jgi:hypothetical protein
LRAFRRRAYTPARRQREASMSVFKPGHDHKGVYYQYFWIKIVSRKKVKEHRKEDLANQKGDGGFLYPEHIGIWPRNQNMLQATEAGNLPTLDVRVGFKLIVEEAEKHDMLIDVRAMLPGESLERAQNWIHQTEGGKAWSEGAYCVLCHVAIEPA